VVALVVRSLGVEADTLVGVEDAIVSDEQSGGAVVDPSKKKKDKKLRLTKTKLNR
jgi:hypothetical protein